MRSGPSLGTWILLIVLGVGSLAAGFGAGLWWLGRDTSPESARWVLTHSARSAQLTPASQGLFTLTMSPADAQVIAVRLDDPGSSEVMPARRLESEWETMFGDESITLTLLVHDATIDADPDAASADSITLLAAEPVVDGDMVTYPVEVLEPTFIAQDGALRAFTEVTLVLPDAKRRIASSSTNAL
jgi:hypothetical protein